MALEYGSGTEADPFLLINRDDVVEFVTNKLSSGLYFALIADLDVSAATIPLTLKSWQFNIDGRGYKLKIAFSISVSTIIKNIYTSKLKNITFEIIAPSNATNFVSTATNQYFLLDNSVFVMNKTMTQSWDSISGTNSLLSGGNLKVVTGSQNIYKHGSTAANTINTSTFADANPYNPDNYTGFDEQYWIFDGVSLPRPRPQDTADLTTRQAIKGITKVGGVGKSRRISFYIPANGLRYKQATSASDGTYTTILNDVTEPVIVLHYDDPGAAFVASQAYALGARIHPTIPNGYAYECTSAGTSDSAAPTDWPTTGTLTSGTAIFTPKPIYAPASHLAVPHAIDIVTGEPVEV